MKLGAAFALAITLSACSLGPQNTRQAMVTIDESTQVALPNPAQLGYELTASQLITASWGETQQQLPVQLQVNQNKVVLAGFSSWGTRILSLQYQDDTIETQVLTGLDDTLPAPEQVLFNLMLTLWPIEAWQNSMSDIGWHIVETANQRTVYDESNTPIIEIRYFAKDEQQKVEGDIVFEHLTQGYRINIQTLSSNLTTPATKNETL
ncbi:DUF3261 domain-containing protein [Vibrio fortis]|uniref:DUF3261 domain-containing protein n=1 Tax=Vibrio fortis TaxID=212667 RepID=UPI0038CD376D